MRTQRSSARHKTLRATAALLLFAGSASCADSLRSLGPSPATAETHAQQLFEAFITRFGANDFAPKYDNARVRLAQAALTPSKVFNDTSIWVTRPSATSRALFIAGTGTGTGADAKYRLEARPTLPLPGREGDTRHTIALDLLRESTYRWETRVDLGVGSVTAEEISLLFNTMLRAPEGRSDREVHDDYRAAFPRAAAAFGRGFAIDSLHITPGALGTTNVVLTGGFHPELMRPAYPALAAYLDKYLGPAKYHLALADPSGAPLFDIVGKDRQMTVRYRLQQGRLTTLSGAPHAWPDSLRLTADVSLKVKLFTVGFHDLVTDFVIDNAGHERSWTVFANREPEWDLPLFTARLIRTPLRRPFEPDGSLISLSVRDSAGSQTLFSRHTRLDVQESTIMRFLGGLASHAVGELDGKVEAEEDRFLRDGFVALAADLRALSPRWK